jgi:16S rRNA (guanine1207-N2)-methyltransferase
VFSRAAVDRGTEILVSALEVESGQSLLDLGCGYGPIGLAVAASVEGARVVMTDVNGRAVSLARQNARRNGLAVDVREGPLFDPVAGMLFDHVASNPPIRAGKSVVYGIVDGAPAHLREGGSLWLVARTRQGAPSLREKMRDTFGDADIVARGGGFHVVRSRRPGNP